MPSNAELGVVLPGIYVPGDIATGQNPGLFTASPSSGGVNFPGYIETLNPWMYLQLKDTPGLAPLTVFLTSGQVANMPYSQLSPNGVYKFVLQSDGNLCVYSEPGDVVVWASLGVNRITGAACLVMNPNGNMEYREGSGGTGTLHWQSNTSAYAGAYPIITDTGTVALVSADGSHVIPATGAGMVGGVFAGGGLGAGGVCLDSASPTQTAPTGHAWNAVPQPPPNNSAYGTNVRKVAGLVSDSRSAARPLNSGAMASDTWLYTADAPMQATGWWIAAHIEATALTGSDVWQIPVELGYYVALQIGNDGAHDFVQLFESLGSTVAKWTFTTGTLTTGKHEIIVRTTFSVSSTCTLWLDGVDEGNQTLASLILLFLSQGFQVGGTLGSGDSFIVQDIVIMPLPSLGNAPATDMSDALAADFYAIWGDAGG